MLETLHIQNLALVDDAWLTLPEGLTVLTGETGAGKTVLLSALKLLLGQRGDVQSISPAADELKVEGSFYFGAEECIVSRTLSIAGRNKCLLNGSLVPVKTLADELGAHVDLHGQHDHQTLLKPALHLSILDAYGAEELKEYLQAYARARVAYKEAAHTLELLQQQSQQDTATFEANRLVLQEIQRVSPQAGEDDELKAALPALEHAEELAQASDEVWAMLTGEGKASDHIARALASIERVMSFDNSFEVIHERLSSVLIEIQEIGSSMRDYAQSIDHDPRKLDDMQARLRELESLSKRFGPSLEEVLRKQEELSVLIDSIDNADEHITRAVQECALRRDDFEKSAEALHRARIDVAHAFCQELQVSLADLALENARFEVAFEPLEFSQWTSSSSDRVEFLYSPAQNAPLRPLAKIASGGEISRVMLAIKSILGNADGVSLLVFDEIDAGVGGATASAVGRRLKELARTHQVIVITHLAQVAIFADAHYVVEKNSDGGRVDTRVSQVSGPHRVKEIARLLSGDTSDLALAHAQELLDSVGES